MQELLLRQLLPRRFRGRAAASDSGRIRRKFLQLSLPISKRDGAFI